MKKAFSILIAILLVVGIITTSNAESNGQEAEPIGIASQNPYYSDFYIISNVNSKASSFTLTPSLSISSPSANKISVTAQAHTSVVVDILGYSSLYIQRWNGSSWVNVASSVNQYKTNTSSFLKIVSASGATSGAYYRAVCTFYAEKNSETESVTVTTSYITCK